MIFLALVFGFVFNTAEAVLNTDAILSWDTCDKDKSCNLQECLNTEKRASYYFGKNSPKITCDPDFINFEGDAKLNGKPKVQNTRVGSFNLLHLGQTFGELEQFKNIPVIAKIINERWDIMAAQELMPLKEVEFTSNELIDYALENKEEVFAGLNVNPEDLTDLGRYYNIPGHLKLLNELQKLDPSWSVILGTIPQGDDEYLELGGFYYRATVIKPVSNKYCEKLGCILKLPLELNQAVARPAFIAQFKSISGFQFLFGTTHVRYGAPKGENATALIEIHQNEMKDCMGTGQKISFKKGFKTSRNFTSKNLISDCGKISADEISRYAELKIMLREFQNAGRILGEDDLIFSGDLNLEPAEPLPSAGFASLSINDQIKYQQITNRWQYVLSVMGRANVYVNEPTTISQFTANVGSRYDHFIFDPKKTPECRYVTAKRFDFADTANKGQAPYIDLQKTFNNIDKFVESKKAVMNSARFLRYVNKRLQLERLWPMGKVLDETEQYRMEASVYNPQRPYKRVLQQMSDHLPIEMLCK